jgi:hypothetical protein
VKRWERAEEARVEVVKAAARVEVVKAAARVEVVKAAARVETTPVLLATPQEKVAATLLGKRIGQSELSLFFRKRQIKGS